MMTMTSCERMLNTSNRKLVDRFALAVTPWGDTVKRWVKEGHLKDGEDACVHFGQDYRGGGWLNSTANIDFEPITLEETDETILVLDGNGAKLRRHKLYDSTPEYVDFTVNDRPSWDQHIRPFLLNLDRRRIPFENYREQRKYAAQEQKFFCWHGVTTFEQMHPVTGYEYMLMGMALDPAWVKDTIDCFSNLTINHCHTLFAEEGKPDGMFFYEDMGFKNKPFMSPAMYEEIIMPGHKKNFDFAHSLGCKIIVHSCGYVEPLVPGLIKAGMDCLQAMEVKAGMDMPTLFKKFGDKIAFFGNIDVHTLIANDKAAIDKELQTKIPSVIAGGGGYILHTDHSELPEVNYETMRYFIDRGIEIAQNAMAAR